MVAVAVYLVILLAVLIGAYFKFLFRRRLRGEPPIPKGHWLWGNGKQFSEHAVNFLHSAQKKVGDIFTLRLFHQHLTVISDVHSFERFVKEKNFDFDAIQRQVNHNVFSFALVDARKMIKEAGKTVKGPYLLKGMRQYAEHLNQAYVDVSSLKNNISTKSVTEGDHEWRTDGLRAFNAKTLFSALFYTIFGKDETAEHFEPNVVFKHFDAFHKYFNYLWLGMPVGMFPNAVKALNVLCKQPTSAELLARGDCSEYIKYATEFMLERGQTENDIIGHNLVYLHVNYNTFRMIFWAVYFLMENPEAMEALKNEILESVQHKMNDRDDDNRIEFSLEEVDSFKVLDSIVKETLRISGGVFMVRGISQDTWFEMNDGSKHFLRKGDKVAMYPPAIHRDPEIFENPDEYKFDRFVDQKFYKNGKEVKTPILSFGSLCPGKKYAITQAKWFLLSLVHMFEFELCEGEKTDLDVRYYGHEILPPTNEVQMRYRLRRDHENLIFV